MAKVDIAIVPEAGGVALMVSPHDREAIYIPMTFDRAMAFFIDFWTTLSGLYPAVRSPDPDASAPLPILFVTGNARTQVSARSDGLVRLTLQPDEMAGLAFELKPEEARALAHQLVHEAEMIEAYRTPN